MAVAALAPAGSPLAGRFSDAFSSQPPMVTAPGATPPVPDASPSAPPPPPTPAAAATADVSDSKIDGLQKTFADIQEKTLKQMQSAEMALNGVKIPDIKLPPKPNVQQTNPAQAWGSAAMVFATLGSLLTRRPLTTAMNAMAGVLKGFREADQTAFDNSFKVWQAESQNALSLGSFELQAYHAALSGIEEKLAIGERIGEAEQNAALAKITATGASFGDTHLQDIVAQYGLPGVIDMFAKRSQVLQQFQENTQKAIDFKGFVDGVKDLQQSPEYKQATPQEQYKMLQDFQNKYSAGSLGEISEDAARLAAERLLAGDTSSLINVGRGIQGSRNLTKILDMYAEEAKARGMSGADIAQSIAQFQGIKAGERVAGGRAAQVGIAANEANAMADLALKASNDVPRGQFVPFNRAQLAVQSGTSDPATARFVAANNSFVNAYARAITPTGAPRIADKEHAYEMLNTAQSQEAYAAVIDQLKLEMQAALKAPADVFKQMSNLTDDKPVGPELLTETGAKGAGGASGSLPKVTSDADYAAVPAGSQYVDPDGNVRTKGGASSAAPPTIPLPGQPGFQVMQ